MTEELFAVEFEVFLGKTNVPSTIRTAMLAKIEPINLNLKLDFLLLAVAINKAKIAKIKPKIGNIRLAGIAISPSIKELLGQCSLRCGYLIA